MIGPASLPVSVFVNVKSVVILFVINALSFDNSLTALGILVLPARAVVALVPSSNASVIP